MDERKFRFKLKILFACSALALLLAIAVGVRFKKVKQVVTVVNNGDVQSTQSIPAAKENSNKIITAAPQVKAHVKAEQKVALAPKLNCHRYRYARDAVSSNHDAELSLDHKNEIQLPKEIGNPSFVCVRVKNETVNFEIKKSQAGYAVELAPGPGPKSAVEVTACDAGAACTEGCEKPKNRFLSSIGVEYAYANNENDDAEAEYKKLQNALEHENNADAGSVWLLKETISGCR